LIQANFFINSQYKLLKGLHMSIYTYYTMKNFKDLLNEFRGIDNPFGGGSGRNKPDPIKEVQNFMKTIPFVHRTTMGDEIGFKSAYHAADQFSQNLALHDDGLEEAKRQELYHMHEYFLRSTGTHEDVLNHIMETVLNHPELPGHLTKWVSSAMEEFETYAKDQNSSRKNFVSGQRDVHGQLLSEFGKQTMKKHYAKPDEQELHPEIDNDSHHIKTIMSDMKNDQDKGYVLLKKDLE